MKDKTLCWIFMAILGSWLGPSSFAIARAQDAPVPRGCSTTPEELQAEKKVVLDFYKAGITLRELIALIDPDYIQHNPLALKLAHQNHLSDYEEFKQLFTAVAAANNPGSSSIATVLNGPARRGGRAPQIAIVTAECDLVTTIVMNTRPDPAASTGATYERFSFDTFRVRGGKLVEHWDDEEITPESLQRFTNLEKNVPRQ